MAIKERYRKIYIVESRSNWSANIDYDCGCDLVLTYCFGVKSEVQSKGGDVYYIDNLLPQSEMEKNNFLVTQFFQNWYLDDLGRDIFCYQGVDFGFGFRLDVWNDLTFYARIRACLNVLKAISFEEIIMTSPSARIGSILDDLSLAYTTFDHQYSEVDSVENYYFPIFRWMDERIRPKNSLKRAIAVNLKNVLGIIFDWVDFLMDRDQLKVRIFVQDYYPTKDIISHLQKEKNISVIRSNFSSEGNIFNRIWRDRPIPLFGRVKKYKYIADGLMQNFKNQRSARLVLADGSDITASIYEVLEDRIGPILQERLRDLVAVRSYLSRHPISLKILIGNLGRVETLVDLVSNKNGVPTYMVINGLLGHHYEDDAKYAAVINAYSTSIRDNYFHGMSNIVCVGDPRMDQYANQVKKPICRDRPVVAIGTSGFSNIDMNSYVAVEFEFIYEVLSALTRIQVSGTGLEIIVKVRANGYRSLYEEFFAEYFPNLIIRIEDNVSLRSVIEESDLYISIYSQSLIEASALGIPCIYHKNDREIMYAPFDTKSELVTTKDANQLHQAINDFLNHSDRYDNFLKESVLVNYVGFLDGRNLQRNLSKIHELISSHIGCDLE